MGMSKMGVVEVTFEEILNIFRHWRGDGKKIEKCHTSKGIPKLYPRPWRVESKSINFIPREFGFGSMFHYKGMDLDLGVPREFGPIHWFHSTSNCFTKRSCTDTNEHDQSGFYRRDETLYFSIPLFSFGKRKIGPSLLLVLSHANRRLLNRPVYLPEVHKALFDMRPNKAPSPDAFDANSHLSKLVQFHPGRQWVGNIIIIREMIHSTRHKKGKKGWMALKLDLEKVYDRISWPFLDVVLRQQSVGANHWKLFKATRNFSGVSHFKVPLPRDLGTYLGVPILHGHNQDKLGWTAICTEPGEII
ncbi:hypothetical protein M9H77_14353 [Catharanthus roseus]|uniref:Uncharacterized protein n=1 Tax=Catharanthus roseus TaxID=4058 RepID=A0ACC0BN33_CATRO|nr:hypothetical protein M9H77_14353 [Catharanthus roseus]